MEEAVDKVEELAATALSRAHREQRRYRYYVGLLQAANEEFIAACRQLREDHSENAEIIRGAELMERFSQESLDRLLPFARRYKATKEKEPRKLRRTLFPKHRHGDYGLLRELQALYLLATEIHVTTQVMLAAAMELRDRDLVDVCNTLRDDAERQKVWCYTQTQDNAAQSLVVPH